jgi:hypothetical protein
MKYFACYFALCVFFFSCDENEPAENYSDFKIDEVFSASANQKIYVKRKAWGLNYNHDMAIVSTSSGNTGPDSLKDFIFKDSEIFYKLSNDTLCVFTMLKAKIPIDFQSKIIIKQIEISNSEAMDLIEFGNYKTKGLKMPH